MVDTTLGWSSPKFALWASPFLCPEPSPASPSKAKECTGCGRLREERGWGGGIGCLAVDDGSRLGAAQEIWALDSVETSVEDEVRGWWLWANCSAAVELALSCFSFTGSAKGGSSSGAICRVFIRGKKVERKMRKCGLVRK